MKRRTAWNELLDQRKKWQDETLASFRERLSGRHRLAASGDLKDLILDVSDAELKMAMKEEILFSPEERKTYQTDPPSDGGVCESQPSRLFLSSSLFS